MGKGLIIAAPSSGSGKTTITLGLLRAFARSGHAIRAGKSGPDYIDPRFHEIASGQPCLNFDAWAMGAPRLSSQLAGDAPIILEGAMGLFDGAPPDGKGAVADLARMFGLPVVLVMDVSSQSHSVAAVLKGFAEFDKDVEIAGVILNKLGSPRHEAMIRHALAPLGLPIMGALYRGTDIELPSRHLGLKQAHEIDGLEERLDRLADLVDAGVDLEALMALMRAPRIQKQSHSPITPPAQRIAVAQDVAFAFSYPHILQDWREMGAEITPFSPLANERPAKDHMVFLPGGYPELHAGQLAAAENFMDGLRTAPKTYGECGGFMAMGDGIIDADGRRHKMAGLLRLETNFSKRKLHLGYRKLKSLGFWQEDFYGHEFHYSTTDRADGAPLFEAHDAASVPLGTMGLINGQNAGSFAHIIDRQLP